MSGVFEFIEFVFKDFSFLGLRELSLFFLIPRSACTLSMVFLEALASNN